MLPASLTYRGGKGGHCPCRLSVMSSAQFGNHSLMIFVSGRKRRQRRNSQPLQSSPSLPQFHVSFSILSSLLFMCGNVFIYSCSSLSIYSFGPCHRTFSLFNAKWFQVSISFHPIFDFEVRINSQRCLPSRRCIMLGPSKIVSPDSIAPVVAFEFLPSHSNLAS